MVDERRFTSWEQVAQDKLGRVVGPEKAHAAFQEGLERAGLRDLKTADDLYRFAQAVAELGGFVAAVGALLGLHAVMHGAKGGKP